MILWFYEMCNSSTCRESIIYIIFLQEIYHLLTQPLSGLPNLQVSIILSVLGLNYSPSSMHLVSILQRCFQFITLFVCFSFLTLLQISWFILSSLLVYATLPPVLWGFHPAYGHPLLCNFHELFSADIFHDPCLQSRVTFILWSSIGVSNGWVWELPIFPTQHSRWWSSLKIETFVQSLKVSSPLTST